MFKKKKLAKNGHCPQCGKRAKPIVYGLPGGDLIQKSLKGEVRLGGCVIYPGMPSFWCPKCDYKFNEKGKKGKELL